MIAHCPLCSGTLRKRWETRDQTPGQVRGGGAQLHRPHWGEHNHDDDRGDSFVRTLKNFSVLCTFGEELELESTVKKKSYLIFIDFWGSIKKNLLSLTYEI